MTTENERFEAAFPDANLKRNKAGGYDDGVTSTLWEGWQRHADQLDKLLRDLNDPRPAEDEPRLCSNNRHWWRVGFNAALTDE